MNSIEGAPPFLIDKFGRKHNYLRISLTDNCNFRCSYCMPADVFGQDYFAGKKWMSSSEIIGLAAAFVSLGVNKIRLTGGEPLIRRDFAEIVNGLSDLGVELTLTTNAYFLQQQLELLKRSNVRSINISLDSLDAGTFQKITGREGFDIVMNAIHEALNMGFRIKLNMVVMRGVNDHELPAFVELTRRNDLHVRFIEFMPFKHNRWSASQVVSEQEILDRVSVFHPVKLEDLPNDTARAYRSKGYTGTFALISTMSHPFCSGCNRLRLTADGKLKNCLFGRDEFDVLAAYKRGEDIAKQIGEALFAKHAESGGQLVQDFKSIAPESIQNRSMIAIGG
ncbi:MAG: GTP 3',8-cyclase MoaA [Sphingobacteriales bacterium]|jgi:cyclic pyranopterin phosphate synthase|nr:GTP 3',8-cyclase MoaA [Sphingobacteriales bacterium]